MRRIPKLFLVLFLMAAGLNLFTELLQLYWPHSSDYGLLNLAELLLFLLAVPVYVGFALNRQQSKLLFIPLLFLLWRLLDFWPLEALLAGGSYRLYAASGQLLLGFLVLKAVRRREVAVASEEPLFSWGHFWFYGLLSVPLLPLILLLLSYATASNLIEGYSAGFVRLKPNGLYMIEKVYVQAEKEIRLAGMIHLGREGYYAALADSFNAGQSLLLAEGVSDTQGLLRGQFSYGNLADLLGLASQEEFRFPGRLIDVESLDLPLTTEADIPDILRADIDLQEFDPRSVEVLNALGRYLLNSSSPVQGYLDFSNWAAQNITPQTNQILMDDLIKKRNQAVLSYLPKGLHKYRTLLIPWGALHMPGIEAAVVERGFVLQESRERLSIDFARLPYEGLWENISGAAGGLVGPGR